MPRGRLTLPLLSDTSPYRTTPEVLPAVLLRVAAEGRASSAAPSSPRVTLSTTRTTAGEVVEALLDDVPEDVRPRTAEILTALASPVSTRD